MNDRSGSYFNLTLDVGTSISKAIYSFENNIEQDYSVPSLYSMSMDSEIMRISQSSLDSSNISRSSIAPENAAWVKYRKKDDLVCVLGLLAKKFQAQKSSHLLKYENAVDKCLAFIGAIALKHDLDVTNLKIKLNLLIPYDEYESEEIIKSTLKAKSRQFYFQGLLIKARLLTFSCFPEGYGGLMQRTATKGMEWLNDKKIAVLMIGHRNCSYLRFEQGQFFKADTIKLGFLNLVQEIKNCSIGQELEDLEYIIPRIGNNISENNNLFAALIKSKDFKNRDKEIEFLKQAIKNSKNNIWSLIKEWLDSQTPTFLHETIILGGASYYFQEEINLFCQWNNPYWSSDTVKEIQRLLFLNFESSKNLVFRFVDAYGLHNHVYQIDTKLLLAV